MAPVSRGAAATWVVSRVVVSALEEIRSEKGRSAPIGVRRLIRPEDLWIGRGGEAVTRAGILLEVHRLASGLGLLHKGCNRFGGDALVFGAEVSEQLGPDAGDALGIRRQPSVVHDG